MKRSVIIYKNSQDPRKVVYVHENQLFRGAILNFGHPRSYFLMALFLAALILPLAGIFYFFPEYIAALAPLWGCIWSIHVYGYCMKTAAEEWKIHPGKKSFRE